MDFRRLLLILFQIVQISIVFSENGAKKIERTFPTPFTKSSLHSPIIWDEEDDTAKQPQILVFEGGSTEGSVRSNEDTILQRKPFHSPVVEPNFNRGRQSAEGIQQIQLRHRHPSSEIPDSRQHQKWGSAYPAFSDTENSCSLCSEERNLCQIVSGLFTRSPLPYGYSKVTSLPVGVCNISIVELKPSKNFFALRKEDESYALNGNWKIQAAGKYGISGALFNYSTSDGKRGEFLESSGPLLEPLDLMVIYQSPNPGIKYEYRIPIQQSQVNFPYGLHQSHQTDKTKLLNHFGYSPIVHQGIVDNGNGKVSEHEHPMYPNESKDIYEQENINVYNPSINKPTIGINDQQHVHLASFASPEIRNSLDQNIRVGADESLNSGVSNTLPYFQNGNDNKISNVISKNHRDSNLIGSKDKHLLSVDGTTFQDQDKHPKTAVRNKKPPKHRLGHRRHKQQIRPGPAVGGNAFVPLKSSKESQIASDNKEKSRKKDLLSKYQRDRKNKKSRNRKHPGKKRKQRFHWVQHGYSDCSKSCGGGSKTPNFVCERRRRRGKSVPERFCEGLTKLSAGAIRCNEVPCPPSWRPGPWNHCSVSCGVGFQSRLLVCVREDASDGKTLSVSDEECQAIPKNVSLRICEMDECPTKAPQWRAEEWSSCSVSCGLGTKHRVVNCIVMGQIEPDVERCLLNSSKPEEQKRCDMGSCSLNTWVFSEWSDKCSSTCGEGVQKRIVKCSGGEDNMYDNCRAEDKPGEERTCISNSGCSAHWFAGPWSDCSSSCGTGSKNREVLCIEKTRRSWSITPEHKCPSEDRPDSSHTCVLRPCEPEWFVSEWNECSNQCGKGFQTREIKCLSPSLQTSSDCPIDRKPASERSCVSNNCIEESYSGNRKHEINHERTKPRNQNSTLNEIGNEPERNNQAAKPLPVLTRYETSSHPNELLEVKDDESVFIGNQDENQKRSKDEKVTNEIKKIITKEHDGCKNKIRNCHLVFRARLCRLKYYNKLCCHSCKETSETTAEEN